MSARGAMGGRRSWSGRSMTPTVSAASSSHPRGGLRCVERCWPSTAQTRRSESVSSDLILPMQARRRAGLKSFPLPPRSGSACSASSPKPPSTAARSRSRAPSADEPSRSSSPILRPPAEVCRLGHDIVPSVSRATRGGSALPASPTRPASAQAVARSTPLSLSPPRRG
jgi:hypothetical protein